MLYSILPQKKNSYFPTDYCNIFYKQDYFRLMRYPVAAHTYYQ